MRVEGHLDRLSAAPGERVRVHASASAPSVELRVVREGAPGRAVLGPVTIRVGDHAPQADAWERGPGWPACFEFAVGDDWPSAVHRVELAGGGAVHRSLLVVRPREPGVRARALLALSTATYAAYSSWGGRSHYEYNSIGERRSSRVGTLRPGIGYDPDPVSHAGVARWELPLLRWCARQGIAVDVATSDDLHRWRAGFDRYRLLLSAGHDEYWSREMRDHVERFVRAGGGFASFGGNTMCWQVRYEDDGATQVCYKHAYRDDPVFARADRSRASTFWSHPLVARPENALLGVGFPFGGYHGFLGQHLDDDGAFTVRDAAHPLFAGTGLRDGDRFGGVSSDARARGLSPILGYECDGCRFRLVDGRPVPTGEDGTPAGFAILAQAPATWVGAEQGPVAREAGVQPHGMATMGTHRLGDGRVFSAGTTDWALALEHDRRVERITRNAIEALGG